MAKDENRSPSHEIEKPPRWVDRVLNAIERIGNKLPDPAALFLILLIIVWILSALLAPIEFSEIDPRTKQPIRINNQLTGNSIATFLSNLVTTFTGFHPLGVVLVALLGVGVAEHTGFINARSERAVELHICEAADADADTGRDHQPHGSRRRLRARDPARGSDLLRGGASSAGGNLGGFRGSFRRVQRQLSSRRASTRCYRGLRSPLRRS